jgi:hypothetical protein
MRGILAALLSIAGLMSAVPAVNATSYTGSCRLIFTPSQRQVCFTSGQVVNAERHLPFRPLNPSAVVLGAADLSLSSVSDTVGIGYTTRRPASQVPAINYLFGKVPAVHGYLRTTSHLTGSEVWQHPYFIVVREVRGNHVGARILTGRFGCPFWNLPYSIASAMDQTIIGCGLAYFIGFMPTRHVSLFVSTNMGPAVARHLGGALLAAGVGK